MSNQLATQALHAGHDASNTQGTQAVPIYQTTSYVFNTSNFGFPKDSAKKARVLEATALVKFSGTSGSTKVVVIPKRGKVFASKLYVPPYKLFEATI